MAIISSFSRVSPLHEMTQEDSIEWLWRCHAHSARQCEDGVGHSDTEWGHLFRRYGVKPSQILQRKFECPDVGATTAWEKNLIYQITESQPAGVDIEQRNHFFAKRARDVLQEFYSSNGIVPNHLIHVTCTGYVSPSAVQSLIADRKWLGKVGVTHAYHMGCYASLPAIRVAMALSNCRHHRIDIVHNEMCSLHMNPSIHTPEQMVVQSLFADGHIKYSVTKELLPDTDNGFRVLAIREWILPDSGHDMTWIPAANGMQMGLSREVPDKIIAQLRECFLEMISDFGGDAHLTLSKAKFAIHPGGPKIIDAVELHLELRPEQVRESHHVLLERGNMSSATLPHIWHEILKSRPPAGTLVVSFAFGPGLTIFGSVFEVINP